MNVVFRRMLVAVPRVAPSHAGSRVARLRHGGSLPVRGTGRVGLAGPSLRRRLRTVRSVAGTAIRERAAALWRLLAHAQPVLRGAAVIAWWLVALGAWLLLVLALPMAVMSAR
jgi:hypothetical protein